jgi:hypothetical protein
MIWRRGYCRCLVTHNLRDFRGVEKFGIEAVAPSEFLKLIMKTA